MWYRLRMIARVLHIGALLLPLIITAPVAYYFGKSPETDNSQSKTEKNSTASSSNQDNSKETPAEDSITQNNFQEKSKGMFGNFWWWYLGFALNKLGASWIKLGQWASTRPDIFSAEFISHISHLCHAAPQHSASETLSTIKSERFTILNGELLPLPSGGSGYSMYTLLGDLSSQCLASGAIAQVHKGYLKDGRKVAVKVLHPGIADLIEMDLELMSLIVSVISFLVKDAEFLSMRDALQHFSASMRLQSNLTVEARNLEIFNEYFKVVAASKSVLIETFEEGETISRFVDLSNEYQKPYNPAIHLKSFKEFSRDRTIVNRHCKYLAKLGINAYLKMMLLDNFIHADLHPGNILVRRKKTKTNNSSSFPSFKELLEIDSSELELVVLDVGLITSCTPTDFDHFKQLFSAVVKKDGRHGAQLMVKYAKVHQIHDKATEDAFVEEMNLVFTDIQDKPMKDIRVGDFLSNILRVVQKYHVKVEGNFATLCVGTGILEGLGRQLDPDLDIFTASIPMLIKAEAMSLMGKKPGGTAKRETDKNTEDTEDENSEISNPAVKKVFGVVKKVSNRLTGLVGDNNDGNKQD